MNRRDALKHVGILLGGVVSAPVINAVLSGCQASDPWKPKILTEEQNDIVTVICDMIIPETETPGAKTLQVNRFMDLIVSDWYKDKDRDRFLNGFAQLADRCQKTSGKTFLDMTPEERTTLLTDLDKEGIDARMEDEENLTFFAMAKELTLVGYFTSETGTKQELSYKPVPGLYHGCISTDEVGKAWARVY